MPANARSHAVLPLNQRSRYADKQLSPRQCVSLKTEARPGQHSLRNSAWWAIFMCRLGDEQEDHTMNAFLRFWMQISRTTRKKLVHSTFNKKETCRWHGRQH